MFSFHYGTALVTGGGSGIGQATAVALAAAGVSVAVADVDEGALQQTVDQIETVNGGVLGLRLDVRDSQSIDRAFAEAEAWHGPITTLVNSAGILQVEPFTSFAEETFAAVMDINVTGSFLCAKRAAAGMKAARYGRIVNLSSVSGFRAGVGRAAYGTSKAAIKGLTRQMALELGPYGITANAVAPGATITAMTEKAYTESTRQSLIPMIPAGYLATPEDICPGIMFLLSQEARYVNGHTLPVDGGYIACGMVETGALKVGV